tara:strand:+ start:516 stop:1055 length:540 start_codon:yes stop_codon:yes gene_type:complete
MRGWLYLIKNGDLYKIGITKNFDIRMKQLKPDNIIARLYSSEYKQLEREFHKRYKNCRIPQTEYFRLDDFQLRDIKESIRKLNYTKNILVINFIKSFLLLIFIFVFLLLFLSSTNKDIVLFSALKWMETISFGLSFFSLVNKSNKYFSFVNELKFRSSKSLIFVLFALFFRFIYRYLIY